ncbi:hypothetical protein FE236_01785 [Mariprofundus erugo]|uniref:Uncharacterized protein n=1 Tax=Mariprofundus erugo TaxID=2528639 RepID=A0A5R9GNH0_9PROT|nr:hypothetical protein [Mariprofundus erugo]TLS66489.1 hypothetical protein FEF65_09990 [Mariprofundus erugo]TLS77865.1 hypothetical protein FE236_01785 [Mariprofundus erugo]
MNEFMAIEKKRLACDRDTALPLRLSGFFDRLLTRVESYHQHAGKPLHGSHAFAWTHILDHAADIPPVAYH